jgi:hypothetical protein
MPEEGKAMIFDIVIALIIFFWVLPRVLGFLLDHPIVILLLGFGALAALNGMGLLGK